MKKCIVGFFATLLLVFMFGCGNSPEQKKEVTLDKVIADLIDYQAKEKRSINYENYLYGIYIGNSTMDYYSINKLGDMTFEERLDLLEALENDSNSAYVVIENKCKLFKNYISIQDIINNGTPVKTVIDIYSIINDVENKVQTYPNGTFLKKITVSTQPSKLNYNYGETSLDISGLIVKGEYLDGTFKTENVTLSDCSNFNSLIVGNNIITITILGRTTNFSINIGNVITTSNFVFIKSVDILKLKQYSANFVVADKSIDTLILTANGGIRPSTVTIINGIGELTKITLDDKVTSITIRAMSGSKQIGLDKIISI